MSGYGRGGRGAALLQALNQPVRKVGQAPAQEEASAAVPTITPPPVLPMGRGAVLASLSQAQQTTQNPQAQAQPRVPMGRGVGLLQPPVTRPQSVGASTPAEHAPVRPMGRGIAAFSASQRQSQSMPHAPSQLDGMSAATGNVLSQPARTSPPALSAPSETFRTSPPAASALPQQPMMSAPPDISRLKIDDQPIITKHGSSGNRLPLSANYIRVNCLNKGVYQYVVHFDPVIDSMRMRSILLNEHRDVIGHTSSFDGMSLFLPIQLPQKETVLSSVRKTDNLTVQITVKLVKVLNPESCIQVYNIIFRRIMRILNMCQVGRHYYDPKHPAQIPQHKLEVWPGYITAIKEHEGGLLLLTDVSHRVLRTETVLDLMSQLYNRNPRSFQEEATKLLVGTTVLTRYNNKTYRIDDIAWDKSPSSTFELHNGEVTTFADYYRKSYNKTLQDKDQPLLIHRPKKKELGETRAELICLMPELSYMTGLTDAIRSDFRVMKDLSAHTRVTPTQRQASMRQFINNVNSVPEAREQLERWGLRLERDTIELEGRQLRPENVMFRDTKVEAGYSADWSNHATKNQTIEGVPLHNWIMVFTPNNRNKAMGFADMLRKVTPVMGIDVKPPSAVQLTDDRTETFLRSLRNSITPQTQCVVIVCPTSRDDRYNAIKKLCCVECPVPSQVINVRTIGDDRKLRSVTQKVALQINCKLGGELWALEIPLKKVMVIGIDVYHEGSGSGGKRGRSVCGFVASMNKTLTRWFSRVVFQMPNEELSPGLKTCLMQAIKKYHEINHELPEKIIVYRDGVGDGQLDTVGGYEVSQLEEVFHHFGESYLPKMAVVVVQKRINTRLFLMKGSSLDNPPPGTVMDHTVTRRDRYDFFLVSQHVRQGTVSPTHYIVVHDNTDLNVDRMQRLTYKLTHLYYNWPGTIRVPAPCQYAHKLAYLVGQNIRKEPHANLCDRLFFL